VADKYFELGLLPHRVDVREGFLTLLPVDPDASAERIRGALADVAGGDVGVLVTDTFGRPWRRGLVNVAIGAAGLPALVDLRGQVDHTGRVLEATVVRTRTPPARLTCRAGGPTSAYRYEVTELRGGGAP